MLNKQINNQFSMKKHLFGFVLTLSAFSASAQSLDLETCLKMADTANLTIKNARLDMAVNDKQISAYMAARLPKLTFTGDYKYNALIPGQVVPAAFFGGPAGSYSTVKFGVPFVLGNTLQLTQVLYNPQVNYGITALKINSQVIAIQEEMTSRDSKQQVASTYFNLQAIGKQIEFIKSNISNMEVLVKNMEATQKQGLVLQTEVDKLNINRLSLVNNLQTMQATKTQLETLLKIQIGMDPSAPISLVSDELVQKSILVDNETVHHPELDLLAAQRKLNEEERKGTSMAYLPSLSFYAAYNYSYNMKPEDNYRVGINSAFLGLQLNWTLFDGLEKYNKQKVNALTKDRINNQYTLAEQQLQMATDNAKRQIDIQKQSLDISQEQLQLAERVYKQSEAQFNQGTISSNDLIMAENGLQQAQTNVVASYVNLRQAELEYLKQIGNIK
jgi:outer membrane protein TolC